MKLSSATVALCFLASVQPQSFTGGVLQYKQIGTTSSVMARTLTIDQSNPSHIYISGDCGGPFMDFPYQGGLGDVWLLKMWTNQTVIWKAYVGTVGDDFWAFHEISANGLYLNSMTHLNGVSNRLFETLVPPSTDGWFAWIAKYHTGNGTREWVKLYGSPGMQVRVFAKPVIAGDFVINSWTAWGAAGAPFGDGVSFTPNNEDILYVKLHAANGTVDFWTIYVGSFRGRTNSAAYDPVSDIFYAAGYMSGDIGGAGTFKGGNYDMHYTRFKVSNNTRLTVTLIGSTSDEDARGIAIDTLNGFAYICGFTKGVINSVPIEGALSDQVLLKLDINNGSVVWVRMTGGPKEDSWYKVVISSAITGYIYTIGHENSTNVNYDAAQSDYAAACFRPDGTLLWKTVWGTGAADQLLSIDIDLSNGVLYLAGFQKPNASFFRMNENTTGLIFASKTAISAMAPVSAGAFTSAAGSVANNISVSSITSNTILINTTSIQIMTDNASSSTSITSTTRESSRTSLLGIITSTTTSNPSGVPAREGNTDMRTVYWFSTIVFAFCVFSLALLTLFIVFAILLKRQRGQRLKFRPNNQLHVHRSDLSSALPETDILPTHPQSLLQLPIFRQHHLRDSNRYSTTLDSHNLQKALFVPGHYQVEIFAFAPISRIFSNSNCDVYCCSPIDRELAQRSHGRYIAVKYMRRKRNPATIDAFNQEISIMHFFHGRPNFVQLVGFCPQPPTIITDFYVLGSLYDCVFQDHLIHFNKRLILRFSLQIASALCEMHLNGFSHSDLKPHNVFVDKRDGEYCCFLADFGISRVLDDTHLAVKAYKVMNLKGLTARYAAPEMIRVFRGFSLRVMELQPLFFLKADVYSFALMMFELLHSCSLDKIQ